MTASKMSLAIVSIVVAHLVRLLLSRSIASLLLCHVTRYVDLLGYHLFIFCLLIDLAILFTLTNYIRPRKKSTQPIAFPSTC